LENIATNGPFTLQSWRDGESAVLYRNPRYGGHFTGNVQQVEVSFRGGGRGFAELEMYEADRLDSIPLEYIPVAEMGRVQQIHAGEYVLLPARATFYLVFDVTQAPFDDLRVRQALAHALNRDTMVGTALPGCYFPASGGFVPPGIPGHSSGIGLPHDPERARRLLAEAGYPGGEGFPAVRMLTYPRSGVQPTDLQAQWREELGVEIPADVLEWAQLVEKIRSDRPCLFYVGWTADYPDPDSFLRVGVRVHSAWRNETYDGLVERARRLTDQAERMRLYQLADRILVEEVPILPLSYERIPLLVKPWVRRFTDWTAWWKDVVIEPH
jgi:ABC-type oligopeptide transport system substrate-binding subunit